jgi:hypothetical protein
MLARCSTRRIGGGRRRDPARRKSDGLLARFRLVMKKPG